jgi:hypothetical protein
MAVLIAQEVIEGGDAPNNFAKFDIRLERASPRPVTYTYFTGEGTANDGEDPPAPADFVPISNGKILFQPGETKETVKIEIIDDDLIEHDEDFYLAVKGRGRTAVGRAIIVDDDVLGPSLRVGHPVVPEGPGPIPASRVRLLGPARIRRMANLYGARLAGS